MDTIIRGGTVVTGGTEAVVDVGIRDGLIAQLGGDMSAPAEIDATGRYVLPGGIDAHVHLTAAGPGLYSWTDDFTVGTRAAAAGGITTVGNMAFPHGGQPMAEGLARDVADAEANAVIDWFLHPVLMNPDEAEVASIEALAAAGHTSIKVFLSFRRFDRNVDGYLRAMQAAAAAGTVVMVHCEDPAIMHCCGAALAEAGLDDARYYPESRPVEAERISTERAVGYCATTGAATYVVHLSSEAALNACRAGRARGLPLYVETRPIYLHLNRDRYAEPQGAKYAGAPPLRADSDREALWAGLADGSISTICTDHAPWTLDQKLDPSLKAADLRQGMAELEIMLPILWSEGVAKGRLSVARFVDVTSTQTAKLFGMYPRKGTIAPGSDADVVVWDPTATRVIDGPSMESNAGWSCYDGWETTGWPAVVLSRGQVVARASADGTRTEVLAAPGQGRAVARRRFTRP